MAGKSPPLPDNLWSTSVVALNELFLRGDRAPLGAGHVPKRSYEHQGEKDNYSHCIENTHDANPFVEGCAWRAVQYIYHTLRQTLTHYKGTLLSANVLGLILSKIPNFRLQSIEISSWVKSIAYVRLSHNTYISISTRICQYTSADPTPLRSAVLVRRHQPQLALNARQWLRS